MILNNLIQPEMVVVKVVYGETTKLVSVLGENDMSHQCLTEGNCL